MAIKSFYPVSEVLRSTDSGILLFNHAGSSVAEDVGRDAQHMADQFGLIVVAADRPGSAYALPSRTLRDSMRNDYVQELARTGKKIDYELAACGIRRVLATGRSSGGLGALAITPTETLPVGAVYAGEAVGWYGTSVAEGKQDYSRYNSRQKKRLSAEQDEPTGLILPHGAGVSTLGAAKRAAGIVLNFFNDRYHNQAVWNQPLSLEAARIIAKTMPDVQTQIDFAEDSMVASQPLIDTVRIELPQLRVLHGATTSFTVDQAPHTVHASFDNRMFMAQRLSPTVDKFIASE